MEWIKNQVLHFVSADLPVKEECGGFQIKSSLPAKAVSSSLLLRGMSLINESRSGVYLQSWLWREVIIPP